MAPERPSTPPTTTAAASGASARSTLTPERLKQIELNRLKAKALRDQREAEARRPPPDRSTAGQKRARPAVPAPPSAQRRDARSGNAPGPSGDGAPRPLDSIRPARGSARYVEYDFSKMTDTKGGFLAPEDDPHGAAAAPDPAKPAHMTAKEWQRHQLLQKLHDAKSGPFAPGAASASAAAPARCRECSSPDVDPLWVAALACAVCAACKARHPERYSLLTKTEARADYLLTEAELRDAALLPRLERPNPHRASWNGMQLFLRYQLEEHALGEARWGSGEALDAAFAAREAERKRRRDRRFGARLAELKKRTRVEAWRRERDGGGGRGEFGDDVGGNGPGKHVHTWGRAVAVDEGTGMGAKRCVECGMEVEEMEL